jgi:O-acetyl-ADP-ribose deacetylase (regulator of RNase III)
VIHTLGPVYGREEKPAEKLASCYKNCLRLAEENALESIAFPAISAGIFGYPIEEAARVAIKAVLEEVPNLKKLKLIRFVLYEERSYIVFQKVLRELA